MGRKLHILLYCKPLVFKSLFMKKGKSREGSSIEKPSVRLFNSVMVLGISPVSVLFDKSK